MAHNAIVARFAKEAISVNVESASIIGLNPILMGMIQGDCIHKCEISITEIRFCHFNYVLESIVIMGSKVGSANDTITFFQLEDNPQGWW